MSRGFLLLILSVVLTLTSAYAEVIKKPGQLILSNALFQRRILFSENEPAAIRVSVISLSSGKALTLPGKPYFEAVVNERRITAANPLWRYRTFSIRAMMNEGEEIKVVFDAVDSGLQGLRLVLYQQMFTHSTIVRERLVFETASGHSAMLNKLDGKLHFRFPQYAVTAPNDGDVTEFRIASWAGELIDFDRNATFDDRDFKRPGDDHNLAHCHMFHPRINEYRLATGDSSLLKGPMAVWSNGEVGWITCYEHASQDNLRGLVDSEEAIDSTGRVDELQGVTGRFDFRLREDDLRFLAIRNVQEDGVLSSAVVAVRGAYLDGERIDTHHPYRSVWTMTAFYESADISRGQQILRDYLFNRICEKPASRRPTFYYNTWGMQRELQRQGKDIYGVMTEEYLLQEIDRAAELGVDLFVIDDGWEQKFGDWTPHRTRLPNGLKPLRERLDSYGMTMGIWLSPLGIDSTAQRFFDHPEWVVLDSEGKPVKSQWGFPTFDFVSDFRDLFVADCKALIDQGVRFFKWDAINTLSSTLPNLHHGDGHYSAAEIRARYAYLLPICIVDAMAELTDYEPELVIEIDVTEARRVMTGLAPLSQGKFFWMNNGASAYGDYTPHRAKSMRTIVNRFAGIIPLELFTFANYPQNAMRSQRYNVNTSLIAGHGFWGALELTDELDRQRIARQVAKSKRVLPYLTEVVPAISDLVGGNPEIYTAIDQETGAGQIVAFSSKALHYSHEANIPQGRVLCVFNHSYSISENKLHLDLAFPAPDGSREAFVIPNEGSGISIVSSSSWLDDASFDDGHLQYVAGAPGTQTIRWPASLPRPAISANFGIEYEINHGNQFYEITVRTSHAFTNVTLK